MEIEKLKLILNIKKHKKKQIETALVSNYGLSVKIELNNTSLLLWFSIPLLT